MDLSIVIVNWNTQDLLANCLQSIYGNPPDFEFEVWVVDNASTDQSAAIVRLQFPLVRLIENKTNVGFACGNNQAIKESKSRHVLLLNSDTIVLPQALERMVSFMNENSRAAIAGGKLLNPDGTFQSSYNDFPSILSELLTFAGLARRVHGPFFPSYGPRDSQTTRVVDWVGGAFLIVRKEAIDSVGLMDEGYFMYGEEMDWCYRMKEAGWQVYYLAEAQILHLGGQSSKAASFDKLLWLTRGHLRFVFKHRGSTLAKFLSYTASFFATVKAGVWLIVGCLPTSSRTSAWEKASANWRLATAELL